MRFVEVGGDDHALACGQAVGLEHGQVVGMITEVLDPLVRRGGALEQLARRVGDAGPLHHGLREPLGRFELGGLAAWTEGQDAAGVERVHQSRCQRRLRADDDQIDPEGQRCMDKPRDVGVEDRQVFAERRRARVAGRADQLVADRAARDRPGQGVLASAAAHDHYAHALSPPPARAPARCVARFGSGRRAG